MRKHPMSHILLLTRLPFVRSTIAALVSPAPLKEEEYMRKGVQIGLAAVLSMMIVEAYLNSKPKSPQENQPSTAPIQNTMLQRPQPGWQRFMSVRLPGLGTNELSDANIAVNLALDTKTGLLCKTWDWKYTPPPPDNYVHPVQQRVDMAVLSRTLPTCFQLYLAHPEVAAPSASKQ
jgi:hypothetical protein